MIRAFLPMRRKSGLATAGFNQYKAGFESLSRARPRRAGARDARVMRADVKTGFRFDDATRRRYRRSWRPALPALL